METRRTNKGGRPALADPAKHRQVRYLNDRDNARFLSQWEQSGVTSKSRFIAARLFGEPFRVVKVDKSAVEYCARLTEFYAQFRAVAVNYNQVVKALNSNFSEKKALAFLYKLEKATTELAMLNRQVIDLTNGRSSINLRNLSFSSCFTTSESATENSSHESSNHTFFICSNCTL